MARYKQSRSLSWFLGAAITVLVAGTGAAWWAVSSLKPKSESTSVFPTSSSVNQSSSQAVPQSSLGQQNQAQVYWLVAQGDKTALIASPITVAKSLDKSQSLQTALEQLLTQTPPSSQSSAIPPGTQLLIVKNDAQGVHVNLSQAFTQGGGSESVTGRLGQLIYTATSLNPQSLVWIEVEGKPLETLGGEGLMIDQPMTRQQFDENFHDSTNP
jgi:spore germination protein GerM